MIDFNTFQYRGYTITQLDEMIYFYKQHHIASPSGSMKAEVSKRDHELNGIRCDVCHKEHPFEPGRIVSGVFAIPDGWFMLYRGAHWRQLLSPIFCSQDCLKSWAATPHDEKE